MPSGSVCDSVRINFSQQPYAKALLYSLHLIHKETEAQRSPGHTGRGVPWTGTSEMHCHTLQDAASPWHRFTEIPSLGSRGGRGELLPRSLASYNEEGQI